MFEALQSRHDIHPTVIVGHSGFGSTLFLRELFPEVAIVNYFEYFYHVTGSDADFRPDYPWTEDHRLRARVRNATFLLDLHNCDRGYTPTYWQHSRLPLEYRHKVDVIFDGIDLEVWRPNGHRPERIGDRSIPDGTKVVTYATRGMESMRGFDVFMKAARELCNRRSDVLFIIAGQDRSCYSGDERFTGGKTFKEWVLSEGGYDLDRFVFTGLLPPHELAALFRLTDLHVYLTVPFVLSWSLLNALACGAVVLASDTAPVREVIEHGRTGLLTDFFDHVALADAAERVLDRPAEFTDLGRAGVELVRERYSADVCLPRLQRLFESVASRGGE